MSVIDVACFNLGHLHRRLQGARKERVRKRANPNEILVNLSQAQPRAAHLVVSHLEQNQFSGPKWVQHLEGNGGDHSTEEALRAGMNSWTTGPTMWRPTQHTFATSPLGRD